MYSSRPADSSYSCVYPGQSNPTELSTQGTVLTIPSPMSYPQRPPKAKPLPPMRHLPSSNYHKQCCVTKIYDGKGNEIVIRYLRKVYLNPNVYELPDGTFLSAAKQEHMEYKKRVEASSSTIRTEPNEAIMEVILHYASQNDDYSKRLALEIWGLGSSQKKLERVPLDSYIVFVKDFLPHILKNGIIEGFRNFILKVLELGMDKGKFPISDFLDVIFMDSSNLLLFRESEKDMLSLSRLILSTATEGFDVDSPGLENYFTFLQQMFFTPEGCLELKSLLLKIPPVILGGILAKQEYSTYNNTLIADILISLIENLLTSCHEAKTPAQKSFKLAIVFQLLTLYSIRDMALWEKILAIARSNTTHEVKMSAWEGFKEALGGLYLAGNSVEMTACWMGALSILKGLPFELFDKALSELMELVGNKEDCLGLLHDTKTIILLITLFLNGAQPPKKYNCVNHRKYLQEALSLRLDLPEEVTSQILFDTDLQLLAIGLRKNNIDQLMRACKLYKIVLTDTSKRNSSPQKLAVHLGLIVDTLTKLKLNDQVDQSFLGLCADILITHYRVSGLTPLDTAQLLIKSVHKPILAIALELFFMELERANILDIERMSKEKKKAFKVIHGPIIQYGELEDLFRLNTLFEGPLFRSQIFRAELPSMKQALHSRLIQQASQKKTNPENIVKAIEVCLTGEEKVSTSLLELAKTLTANPEHINFGKTAYLQILSSHEKRLIKRFPKALYEEAILSLVDVLEQKDSLKEEILDFISTLVSSYTISREVTEKDKISLIKRILLRNGPEISINSIKSCLYPDELLSVKAIKKLLNDTSLKKFSERLFETLETNPEYCCHAKLNLAYKVVGGFIDEKQFILAIEYLSKLAFHILPNNLEDFGIHRDKVSKLLEKIYRNISNPFDWRKLTLLNILCCIESKDLGLSLIFSQIPTPYTNEEICECVNTVVGHYLKSPYNYAKNWGVRIACLFEDNYNPEDATPIHDFLINHFAELPLEELPSEIYSNNNFGIYSFFMNKILLLENLGVEDWPCLRKMLIVYIKKIGTFSEWRPIGGITQHLNILSIFIEHCADYGVINNDLKTYFNFHSCILSALHIRKDDLVIDSYIIFMENQIATMKERALSTDMESYFINAITSFLKSVCANVDHCCDMFYYQQLLFLLEEEVYANRKDTFEMLKKIGLEKFRSLEGAIPITDIFDLPYLVGMEDNVQSIFLRAKGV